MELFINSFNIVAALATIGLGAFGLLRPAYTMDLLGLQATDDTGLGISEVRAASGGLWIGAAFCALIIFSPTAFVMLGGAWAGAALGRFLAILFDGANKDQPVVFFGVELAFAVLLIGINLPAIL